MSALVQSEVAELSREWSGGRLHEKRWFVLHTRGNQEKKVAEQLSARDVEHFLPVSRHTRQYGRRREQVDLPLFTGYVFLFGSVHDAYEQDRARRLVQIIEVRDQDRLDHELANIRAALERGADLSPHRHLRQGVRVRVHSGPFEGLDGVIEDRTSRDRLVMQVDMLGRSVALELDGDVLEMID